MCFKIERVLTAESLQQIWALYESSFPVDERRAYDQLSLLLSNKYAKIYKFYRANELAGLVVIWEFEAFLFIEHFAVMPKMQNQGIGKNAVSHLIANFQMPILLEVEPPFDAQSERRIKFYEGLGFRMLNLEYMQPAYANNKSEVRMKLMANVDSISNLTVNEWISQLKREVYNCQYE